MSKYICIVTRWFSVPNDNGPDYQDSERISVVEASLQDLSDKLGKIRYETALFNVQHNQQYVDRNVSFEFSPIYLADEIGEVPVTLLAMGDWGKRYAAAVEEAETAKATAAREETERLEAQREIRDASEYARLSRKFGKK